MPTTTTSSSGPTSFGWNKTWTTDDPFLAPEVACMFAAALRERFRAVFPSTRAIDFALDHAGGIGNYYQLIVEYLVSPPPNAITAAEFSPLSARNGMDVGIGGFFGVCPYKVAGSYDPDSPLNGDRVRLDTTKYIAYASAFFVNPTFLPIPFFYGMAQMIVVALSKCYYENKSYDGYSPADLASDIADFQNYYYPDDPDSYNPPYSSRVPSALYHKLPNWPSGDPMTRKREREISRVDDPASGTVARFCYRKYRFGDDIVAPPSLTSSSGTPDTSSGIDDTHTLDPDPFRQNEGNDGFRVQYETPDDQRKYAQKVMVYRAGKWTPADGSDTSSTFGSTSGSSMSIPDVDIVEGVGFWRPGDLFGPWVLNELRDAINALQCTIADTGGTGGSSVQGVTANYDRGVCTVPCFAIRSANYYAPNEISISSGFSGLSSGDHSGHFILYGEAGPDTTVDLAVTPPSGGAHTPDSFAVIDWSGGFKFGPGKGNTATCADDYPTDTCGGASFSGTHSSPPSASTRSSSSRSSSSVTSSSSIVSSSSTSSTTTTTTTSGTTSTGTTSGSGGPSSSAACVTCGSYKFRVGMTGTATWTGLAWTEGSGTKGPYSYSFAVTCASVGFGTATFASTYSDSGATVVFNCNTSTWIAEVSDSTIGLDAADTGFSGTATGGSATISDDNTTIESEDGSPSDASGSVSISIDNDCP